MGLEFQEEFSDMLLLNMLRSATKASGDKDRVGTFFFISDAKSVLYNT